MAISLTSCIFPQMGSVAELESVTSMTELDDTDGGLSPGGGRQCG